MRFLSLLLLPLTLVAIDYSPWFQRVLYFEGRVQGYYEWGRGDDLLRNEFALEVTPWTDIRAEIEIDTFQSRTYTYSLEALKLNGQYRFLNDVQGDPLTLVAGATFILPTTRAKNEYVLFYPGSTMVEFHLTLGKECDFERSWSDRGWIDITYGIANEKSPWWRFHGQTDWNLEECGIASLFLKSLAGAGTRTLEFGAQYQYPIEWGTLSLKLMRRPIAHGSLRATGITLEFITPLAF